MTRRGEREREREKRMTKREERERQRLTLTRKEGERYISIKNDQIVNQGGNQS